MIVIEHGHDWCIKYCQGHTISAYTVKPLIVDALKRGHRIINLSEDDWFTSEKRTPSLQRTKHLNLYCVPKCPLLLSLEVLLYLRVKGHVLTHLYTGSTMLLAVYV